VKFHSFVSQGSVFVHTSGEMESFYAHCLALIAVATCQIWWKFINNSKSYTKKHLAYLSAAFIRNTPCPQKIADMVCFE